MESGIEEMVSSMTIGQRVRCYRTIKNLSQTELARLCHYYPAEISAIEKDLKPGITARRLSRIAHNLGITSAHLMGEVPFDCNWPDKTES